MKKKADDCSASAALGCSVYVIGFMFSSDMRFVVLIRKARPEWQRGKLNGIGGHIENGETGWTAMVREFEEETGCRTKKEDWQYYAVMGGRNEDESRFECHCYAMVGDLKAVHTVDGIEPVLAIHTHTLLTRHDPLENIPWLVHLAIDHLSDGRPGFVKIDYP